MAGAPPLTAAAPNAAATAAVLTNKLRRFWFTLLMLLLPLVLAVQPSSTLCSGRIDTRRRCRCCCRCAANGAAMLLRTHAAALVSNLTRIIELFVREWSMLCIFLRDGGHTQIAAGCFLFLIQKTFVLALLFHPENCFGEQTYTQINLYQGAFLPSSEKKGGL
jgi:hypothetical protein